jgi:hypothetical protein
LADAIIVMDLGRSAQTLAAQRRVRKLAVLPSMEASVVQSAAAACCKFPAAVGDAAPLVSFLPVGLVATR